MEFHDLELAHVLSKHVSEYFCITAAVIAENAVGGVSDLGHAEGAIVKIIVADNIAVVRQAPARVDDTHIRRIADNIVKIVIFYDVVHSVEQDSQMGRVVKLIVADDVSYTV